MPPPMPNLAKRMTANPARPVGRYRPGKVIAEKESSEEEYESEEEVQKKKKPQRPQQRRPPAGQQAKREHCPSDDEDEEGFVTDPEDDEDGEVQLDKANQNTAGSGKSSQSQSTVAVQQDKRSNESEEDDEEDEESEEDSEDEDESSSSEEEEPRQKFQRPTFIKKSDRNASSLTTPLLNGTITTIPAPPSAQDNPETQIDEQARRLAQAELMIKDKLERDALARAAGRKAWDDDEEVSPEAVVDDTDGIDPEAEYAAWKLRELKRLKRDREAIEAREREIEEIERRRNLTVEERDKEDKEFLDKQREEKEDGRGKAAYLARYHHKGAFFQDDAMAEILKKRDLMGARFVDEVADKSALPEYMRIRDMNKLGKKGRTRYTDLRSEDTGRFGDDVKRWKGPGGETSNPGDGFDARSGVDSRFLPDKDRDRIGPTGANASSLGQRHQRRSRSRSPRRIDERDRNHGASRRTRSYSRSLSPVSDRGRKRSLSPYRDRDKRRKVDVT